MLTVKKTNDNGMGIPAPKFGEQDTNIVHKQQYMPWNTKIFSLVCSSNIYLIQIFTSQCKMVLYIS